MKRKEIILTIAVVLLAQFAMSATAFEFTVNPQNMTVAIDENATYTLEINNTENSTDTFDLALFNPSTNASISTENVTVDANSTGSAELTVMSNVTGTFTVGVTATSEADTNNSMGITTETTVGNQTPPPPPPPTEEGVVATREIADQAISPGGSTDVTVDISTNITQGLSLQETVPEGWNVTRVTDDADSYKENGSNAEWLWVNVTSDMNKTVVYKLTAPEDAGIGPYTISGTVLNAEGVVATVGGNDTVLIAGNVTPGNVTVGRTWNVNAGGQTRNMAIQGMAFYPGIITVNVGDVVKWTVQGNFHTISFLSGQVPPADGSPEQLSPHGGSTYDGTGMVSSGILPTGSNYSVQFTEPGVFAYRCLIHPGMQGIVIVQPNGDKYPLSRKDYRNQAQDDLAKDIDAGRQLANQVPDMITSSYTNGTTKWQTFTDLPLPEMVKVYIDEMNKSNVKGRAFLNMTSPANINVNLKVFGLEPNSEHSANIKIGTCNVPGSTVFAIGNLNADENGRAEVVADMNVTPPFGIMNRGWIIDITNNNDTESGSVACGEVVKHDAARMRFATRTLTIDQGDTVTWTQLNPMEIHTVSFLAENQTSPELLLPGFQINPEIAAPSGTNEYDGTGYHNSGILIPGASYSLTFTESGMFKYECELHDDMKMIGYIKVNPRAGEVTQTPTEESNVSNLTPTEETNVTPTEETNVSTNVTSPEENITSPEANVTTNVTSPEENITSPEGNVTSNFSESNQTNQTG